MGQGIMISRPDPEEHFAEGTAEPLTEDALRRRLADLDVEVSDAQERATLPGSPPTGRKNPAPTKHPGYITNASSWEEADEHFDTFMEVVTQRRREVAERVAVTGGPVLDLSVESLGAVNEWFIATVLDRPEPAEVDYRPAWAAPPNPDFVPGPGKPSTTPGWHICCGNRSGSTSVM